MLVTRVWLPEFTSSSEYCMDWDTPGLDRDNCRACGGGNWYLVAATVTPGSYLHVHYYYSDAEDYQILLQLPDDPEAFRRWCELASNPERYRDWMLSPEYVVRLWDQSYYEDWDGSGDGLKPRSILDGLLGTPKYVAAGCTDEVKVPWNLEGALRLAGRD